MDYYTKGRCCFSEHAKLDLPLCFFDWQRLDPLGTTLPGLGVGAILGGEADD